MAYLENLQDYANAAFATTKTASTGLWNQFLFEAGMTKRQFNIKVNPELLNTVYFRDNRRRIDFILAYRNDTDDARAKQRELFLANAQHDGLEFEEEDSSLDQSQLRFIKVHAPIKTLRYFAQVFDISLYYEHKRRFPLHENTKLNRWMATNLTRFKGQSPEPQRVTRSQIAFEAPLTSSDRIEIVYHILSEIYFGPKPQYRGLNHAINQKVFIKGYPLHDGDLSDDDDGSINAQNPRMSASTSRTNDRQLLMQHWGAITNLFKHQPLDLINKYFGNRIGLYFCWLGFYIQMLVWAAIFGVICIVYGLIDHHRSAEVIEEEICQSTAILCPRCQDFKYCQYNLLRSYCNPMKLSLIFDHFLVIVYAVFVAIWGTVFIKLWQQKLAFIRWHWHLLESRDFTTEVRPEYKNLTSMYERRSEATGQMEHYLPWQQQVWRFGVSTIGWILMFCFMVMTETTMLLFRLKMKSYFFSSENPNIHYNSVLITNTLYSTISLTIMVVMSRINNWVAYQCTHLECPKTDIEFEQSFTFKRFSFIFVNYYMGLFYIAFIRGRFASHPGDPSAYQNPILSDDCGPTGCIIDLVIQVTITMCGKHFFNMIKEVTIAMISTKTQRKTVGFSSRLPNWEKEFALNTVNFFTVPKEVEETALQYGFIIMFAAASPIMPLVGCIRNMMELRFDAYKFLKYYQRPVSRKIVDMGAYENVLKFITYLGVCTNALLIGFTIRAIPLFVYSEDHRGSYKGYTEFAFSDYNMSDYQFEDRDVAHRNVTQMLIERMDTHICKYHGFRNPPDHPKKYQLNFHYWRVMSYRGWFIIVFEHLVLLSITIVAYVMPSVPSFVKSLREYEFNQMKSAKFKEEKL